MECCNVSLLSRRNRCTNMPDIVFLLLLCATVCATSKLLGLLDAFSLPSSGTSDVKRLRERASLMGDVVLNLIFEGWTTQPEVTGGGNTLSFFPL
jgi:hypothetical protein